MWTTEPRGPTFEMWHVLNIEYWILQLCIKPYDLLVSGGHILAQQYSHLNNWVYPFSRAESEQLVAHGYQEHVGLGRRWATRLQELLGGTANAEISFLTSDSDRAQDSAKGFKQVSFINASATQHRILSVDKTSSFMVCHFFKLYLHFCF